MSSIIGAPKGASDSRHNYGQARYPFYPYRGRSPVSRFPAAARLHCSSEFEHVFSAGRSSKDGCFVVLFSAHGGHDARLGMAISRRRARRAVDRNRIKRIVRESFRQHAAILCGLDIIVLAQRKTVATQNQALFSSLSKHWRNLSHNSQTRE